MKAIKKLLAYTAGAAGVGALLTGVALAQNPFSISFPIAELGGCGSQEECRIYCDETANARACTVWAQDNGFAQKPEVRREALKQDSDAPEVKQKVGPGGCGDRESCDMFCRQPSNNRVCIDFAVAEGFMSQAEADRIVKLTEQLESRGRGSRAGPRPAVARPTEPDEPQIDEEKALQAIAEFGGPGGCSSFAECDRLCGQEGSADVCFAYAVEHDLMQGSDVEKFKKLMDIEGPGGCRGRECQTYCDVIGNERACLDFAAEQGFIEKEEYEKAKKFIDIEGPGGCRGRECEEYCNNPNHQQACFEFAKQNGLIDEEDIRAIEEMELLQRSLDARGREREVFDRRRFEEKNRTREEQQRNEQGVKERDSRFGDPDDFVDSLGGEDGYPPGVNDQRPPFGGEFDGPYPTPFDGERPPPFEGDFDQLLLPPEGYEDYRNFRPDEFGKDDFSGREPLPYDPPREGDYKQEYDRDDDRSEYEGEHQDEYPSFAPSLDGRADVLPEDYQKYEQYNSLDYPNKNDVYIPEEESYKTQYDLYTPPSNEYRQGDTRTVSPENSDYFEQVFENHSDASFDSVAPTSGELFVPEPTQDSELVTLNDVFQATATLFLSAFGLR